MMNCEGLAMWCGQWDYSVNPSQVGLKSLGLGLDTNNAGHSLLVVNICDETRSTLPGAPPFFIQREAEHNNKHTHTYIVSIELRVCSSGLTQPRRNGDTHTNIIYSINRGHINSHFFQSLFWRVIKSKRPFGMGRKVLVWGVQKTRAEGGIQDPPLLWARITRIHLKTGLVYISLTAILI